ncbi:MAG: hypothetical protein IJX77_09080 [Ruminococcus sp.]|nr:hypothetical protein [Ruminococcus sp.]
MNINDYKKVTDRLEISERCREEVLNMRKGTGKIKHKMSKKAVALIAAAVMTVGAGTAAVAANHFGVFDRLSGKKDRTITLDNGVEAKIDKFDNNNYEIIGQHAQDVTAAAQSEELSVNVESVYCDGSNLIVALTGSLADGNPSGIISLNFNCDITIDGETYSVNALEGWSQNYLRLYGNMVLDEGETNSFTGSISLTLQTGEKIENPTTADIRLYNISCGYKYVMDNAVYLDSEVNLTVDVVPEPELVQECYASMSENGFEAKIYEVSPSGITIGSKYPRFYDTNTETVTWYEGENLLEGPKYSVGAQWFDENGNRIELLDLRELPDYGDGFNTGILASTDSSTITVKWFNKQTQGTGDKELLYEYTFTLPE